MNERIDGLKRVIRDIPDFPKPGIVFKDITPLLRDPEALKTSLDLLAAPFRDKGVTAVVGIESRGFVFGVPVADRLGVGFVPVRKPGKLPAETLSETYDLEYGQDTIEMHKDALGERDKVLIIDDLLATGGTAKATRQLVSGTGASIVAAAFVIELSFLNGKEQLAGLPIVSLIVY